MSNIGASHSKEARKATKARKAARIVKSGGTK